MRLFTFLLIGLLFSFPFTTFGYSERGTGEEVSVFISPEHPGANQTVSLSLSSYALDLDSSTISWKQNGKILSQGIGQKMLSFTSGPTGSKDTILITITAPGGERATKELIFNHTEVDLLWEALTTAPPLYPGKTLPTGGVFVKVTALPRLGTLGVAEKLIYTWEKDGLAVPAGSGYGKQAFYYKTEAGGGRNVITVTVHAADNSYAAEGEVGITTVSPFILLYPIKPLAGLSYQTAIGSELNLTTVAKVKAEPYFFSLPDQNLLEYSWRIGGELLSLPANQKIIDWRASQKNSLTSLLSVGITDPRNPASAAHVTQSLTIKKWSG